MGVCIIPSTCIHQHCGPFPADPALGSGGWRIWVQGHRPDVRLRFAEMQLNRAELVCSLIGAQTFFVLFSSADFFSVSFCWVWERCFLFKSMVLASSGLDCIILPSPSKCWDHSPVPPSPNLCQFENVTGLGFWFGLVF